MPRSFPAKIRGKGATFGGAAPSGLFARSAPRISLPRCRSEGDQEAPIPPACEL